MTQPQGEPVDPDGVLAALKDEVTEDCIDAIAERPANEDGEVPSEPRPPGALLLSDEEYLNAYFDGIHAGNAAARAEFRRRIAEYES